MNWHYTDLTDQEGLCVPALKSVVQSLKGSQGFSYKAALKIPYQVSMWIRGKMYTVHCHTFMWNHIIFYSPFTLFAFSWQSAEPRRPPFCFRPRGIEVCCGNSLDVEHHVTSGKRHQRKRFVALDWFSFNVLETVWRIRLFIHMAWSPQKFSLSPGQAVA